MPATVAVLMIAVTVVACSGSDDATSPVDSAAVTGVAGGPTTGASATSADSTASDRTGSTTPTPPLETFEPIDTVPVDGVPGIDSDDAFCQAWSEFGGTFQALALASHAATDEATARRAELAAAHALGEALATMTEQFPMAIDDAGRQEFLDGLLGPFARRAAYAESFLLEAGLTPEQLGELGDLWIATLASTGLGDPDIDVDIPAAMQPAFDQAQAAFEAAVPAIPDDPSLITDVAAEETAAHIAATCPDQGTLGGNDFVGD